LTAGFNAAPRLNAVDYGRSNGGVTVVQNPVDAQHPSMPLNAINNMEVDDAVNIPDMPALLSQLVLEGGTGESVLF